MAALAGSFSTSEAGYIEQSSVVVADWLRDGLDEAHTRRPHWGVAADVVALLAPNVPLNRHALIPFGRWTVVLSNGPRGTDVGMLPSLAAREWGCAGIRAVCTVECPYPARILEVFGPGGSPPLFHRRSITAANDGGRWVFETAGAALAFEDQEAYYRARKADRLTPDLLFSYLRELGVPVDEEPEWSEAILVEQQDARMPL